MHEMTLNWAQILDFGHFFSSGKLPNFRQIEFPPKSKSASEERSVTQK